MSSFVFLRLRLIVAVGQEPGGEGQRRLRLGSSTGREPQKKKSGEESHQKRGKNPKRSQSPRERRVSMCALSKAQFESSCLSASLLSVFLTSSPDLGGSRRDSSFPATPLGHTLERSFAKLGHAVAKPCAPFPDLRDFRILAGFEGGSDATAPGDAGQGSCFTGYSTKGDRASIRAYAQQGCKRFMYWVEIKMMLCNLWLFILKLGAQRSGRETRIHKSILTQSIVLQQARTVTSALTSCPNNKLVVHPHVCTSAAQVLQVHEVAHRRGRKSHFCLSLSLAG